MVQWPELCGRGASSFTSTSPSRVTNISTASRPTSFISCAMWRAIASAFTAIAGVMRAGAMVVSRMWLRCWFSTGTYIAIAPSKPRAITTEISRWKSTKASRIASSPPMLCHTGPRSVSGIDAHLALAVIAEAGGLEHARPAQRLDRLRQRLLVRDLEIARHRHVDGGEEVLFPQPLLGQVQHARVGPRRLPLRQLLAGGRGHVLELEGHDIDRLREPLQRGEVVIGGNGGRVGDVAGRRVLVRAIDVAAIAEPRGRHGRHAPQLPAAQDADRAAGRDCLSGIRAHVPTCRRSIIDPESGFPPLPRSVYGDTYPAACRAAGRSRR